MKQTNHRVKLDFPLLRRGGISERWCRLDRGWTRWNNNIRY